MPVVTASRKKLGYSLCSVEGQWVAQYLPRFHQVWTNPTFSHERHEKSLCHEFVHMVGASFHPAQLYPALNYLSGENHFPDVGDFFDVIEALYVAMHPLVFRRPISLRALPRGNKKALRLAKRIVMTAKRFSESCPPTILRPAALSDSLWALYVVLINVVPLRPDQGENILERLAEMVPPHGWKTSRELYKYVFSRLAEETVLGKKSEYSFSLARPAEPHRNISQMLSFLSAFVAATEERAIPVTPVLLIALSLGLFNVMPVLRIERWRENYSAAIEIWNGTRGQIRTSKEASKHGLGASAPADSCVAWSFYRELFRNIASTRFKPSPNIFGKAAARLLEILPVLVRRYLRPKSEASYTCPHCRIVLAKEGDSHLANTLFPIDSREKTRLIRMAERYPSWLASGCLRTIEKELELDSVIQPLNLSGFSI